MAKFKISKKDFISDNRTTLDDLHEKKMSYFEKEYIQLSSLEQKKESLTKKILNEKLSIHEKNILIQEIKTFEEKIKNIKNDSERIEYLLDFMPFASKIDTSSDINNTSKKGSLDNFVSSTIDNSKIELFNDYIKKFNPEGIKEIVINKKKDSLCKYCKNDNFIIDYHQSYEICENCGKVEDLLILPSNINNIYTTEDTEQINYFEYKRKNHFIECLNQLQAKENTRIPDKIINDLTLELKKYNISNPKLITPILVKQYLKKLGHSKYYEHIPVIINEICGMNAPKFNIELEEQLKVMFDKIQDPFEKHSQIINSKRKNFLNYNYVLYKMCELLNKNSFLPFFPLLKSREKLYEHDLIWKGICNELKWKFIPSV